MSRPKEARTEMASMDYRTYASPFSWRYGRAALRSLFSEAKRRRLWRAAWVALAEAQSTYGLIDSAELADMREHAHRIDIEAALEIEREIHHDLMAEIRVFASQAKIGGGKLHLGATSMDIEDTVETYRLRLALACVGESLHDADGGVRREGSHVRRPRVHGVHAPSAGRTDDAGLSLRRLRARPADRRCRICASFSRT